MRPVHIFIEVQDSGRGISPERLAEVQRHGGGLGIRGMRERLLPFNGELNIDSNELGTKIRAVLLATTTLDQQHSMPEPRPADPVPVEEDVADAGD